MTTELTTRNLSADIEAALLHGDLGKLTTEGRLQYYKAFCESVGLNPLTQPLAYIMLNGKLQLYAKRDCAEQLRKLHSVSVLSMSKEVIGEVYVVTVEGRDKTGRTDWATGAVPITGLKGEPLANAYLKAETKAKRRLTLSICGLGLLDETEVASIPDAKPFSENPQAQAEAKWAAIDPEGFKAPQPGDKLRSQLEASLTAVGVGLSPTPQKPQEQASTGQEYPFSYADGKMNCRVLGIIPKQTKPGKNGKTRPFLNVTFNGRAEGFNFATCFDTKLFDVLQDCLDKQCEIALTFDGKFLGVKDVLSIDGVKLSSPEIPEPEPSDADDSIPF